MSKKKQFVLRISPEMYEKIEKWASDEFRSTNGQIEYLLNRALKEAGRHPGKDQGGSSNRGSPEPGKE